MRYHPLFAGLWSDERLGSFEARAFFAFLFSNERVRPSGIYRASDSQLALDAALPVRRVRDYLARLERAGRIVRDPPWLFVVGYLKRQPHSERLLVGVRQDVSECTSPVVLEAFGLKYPLHNRWSTDRLKTIKRPSPDGHETVSRLEASFVPPNRTEQNRTEQNYSARRVTPAARPASALQGAPAEPPPAQDKDKDLGNPPAGLAPQLREFMATLRRVAASPAPGSVPRPGPAEAEL